MSDIKLNPSQKQAVEHDKGPLLIIAGAGTGKTRVITQRIIHLTEKKLATPDEILALTFTQKAAQEMEERVDIAMPYGYQEIWISTFHSFCDKVLKQEAVYIGLDPAYILMSQAQEYMFFRSKLFGFNLKRFRPYGNPTKFIGAILKHFSRLGDENVSPAEYEKFVKAAKDLDPEQKRDYIELVKVYKEYSDLKTKESRMGFSDLVPYTLKVFRDRPAILKRYQDQFKYILVDEFQDTNYAQNELVKILAGKNGNITVVGDDDQAIYKFRGAAISNILDFKKTFPKCKKVVLTENYRSHQKILDQAYDLIRKNDPYRLEVTEKVDKKLKFVGGASSEIDLAAKAKSDKSGIDKSQLPMSIEPEGCLAIPVQRLHAVNDVEEAELVSKEILKLVKSSKGAKSSKKFSFSDIAVLVRANNHADTFVQSFRVNDIPVTFTGPKGLYNRPEIKDLLAILRVIADYKDDISMYRVLTLDMVKLSPREFIDLQSTARRQKTSVFEFIENGLGIRVGAGKNGRTKNGEENHSRVGHGAASEKTGALSHILSTKSLQLVSELFETFEQAFKGVKERQSVGKVLYDFVESLGYVKFFVKHQTVTNEWKIQNICKYFASLKRFELESDEPSLLEYLDYLKYSLEIGESPNVDPMDIVDYNAVNILTLHGAKGLEFPVVFVVNMVSDRFPTRRRSEVLPIPEGLIKEVLPGGDEHTQEERRLCYVGMTRAKDLLYLSSADYYGDGIRKKKQSVFLHDMDLVVEPEHAATSSSGDVDAKSADPKGKDIPPGVYRGYGEGDEVTHEIPKEAREMFLSKIIRNLSYSHISSYNSCPKQFYFKYFLGIPGAESQARSFGITVHVTLKTFYEAYIRYKNGFSEITEIPDCKNLLDIYEKKWIDYGYESKEQEQQRFKAGKLALKKYFDKFFTGKEDPWLLEYHFRADLGGFMIKGVADRVDKVGDSLEIIDYKTGKVPRDSKKMENNLQLPIYVLALEKRLGKKVRSTSLLYVGAQEKYDITVGDAQKERAVSEIKNTLVNIKKMDFHPITGPLCKFCDYRNICDDAVL
ncbi:MAG: UvrD-helicase domain-containing protein [Patescibacteria group bacterium]|nr:UvrD-helicase domain-containing protein [Patescibacteria group bacterium]